MTITPDEAGRDWPATYAALGRVIVEGSRLEFLLEDAVAHLTEPPTYGKGQAAAHVEALRTAATARGSLTPDRDAWLDEVGGLLARRNSYVHAHWPDGTMTDRSPDGRVVEVVPPPIHYRLERTVDDDPVSIGELADDLADATRRGWSYLLSGDPNARPWRETPRLPSPTARRDHGQPPAPTRRPK